MQELVRAPNTESAQRYYIHGLYRRYRKDKELSSFGKKACLAFARKTIIYSWPIVMPINKSVGSDGKRVWEYSIMPGEWSAEIAGALGGDLNLHIGNEATLPTTGLIGISAAAIADDIGGSLLAITPVCYLERLRIDQTVNITIVEVKSKMGRYFFNMTGIVLETGRNLFKPADIVMSGVQFANT